MSTTARIDALYREINRRNRKYGSHIKQDQLHELRRLKDERKNLPK